jgi:hypothetical protein
MPARALPPAEEARRRAISAIDGALVQRRRRRVWQRVGSGVLVAAVALSLLLLGNARRAERAPAEPQRERAVLVARDEPKAKVLSTSGVRLDVTGAERAPGLPGEELAAGARVTAPAHGHAVLTFASGSKITIEEGGEVLLVDVTDSHVLALEHGALRAAVVKLGPRQRFLVRTQDAEVEVHGTSFRVATATEDARCGAGARTRLEVYEGVVSVRAQGLEARVAAGDVWPRGCGPALRAKTLPADAAHERHAHGKPELAATPVHGAETGGSELARENDIFERAIAARHDGDLARALGEFEALLARFPDGPLAEDATVQRMKLLDTLDRTRAVVAAREYLVRYPRGFARADAQAILNAH